jgi:hypothetical protein
MIRFPTTEKQSRRQRHTPPTVTWYISGGRFGLSFQSPPFKRTNLSHHPSGSCTMPAAFMQPPFSHPDIQN